MSQKIINKRSSVITEDGNPKLPSSDTLDYGEIAINYADGVETLSIKNSVNEVVEFKSKEYYEEIELVTSTALNDLNARMTDVETNKASSTHDHDDRYLKEHQDISHLATQDELNSKQDTLVSGTNIKTINNEDLIGEGNIIIPGKDVTGEIFTINETNVTAGSNAEIFNDYTNNIATGKYSHAENYQTTSKGSYSHAEGYGTLAAGAASHAEGYNTQATARYAHAEGASCIASGNNSHAEGNECKSVGHYSHAEGNFTTANGSYSHTEGNYSKTNDSATYAHAEGSYTEANATGAHAEGNHTISAAIFTHTEGMYTNASSAYQHVRGKYNEIDTNGIYNTIIGNGTSESDRRNIFTIDWDGNIATNGKVTIGDNVSITDDMDLISLKYLQNTLSNYSTTEQIQAMIDASIITALNTEV